MKKKLCCLLYVALCFTIIFTGCSNESNQKNINNKSIEDEKQVTDKNSSKIDGSAPNNSNNKSSHNEDAESKKENNNDVSQYSTNLPQQTTILLNNIMNEAQNGGIINTDIAAKKNTISDVEGKYGSAREVTYIAEAKGSYASYPDNNLAFGFNKAGQLFEVRSFSNKLNKITLSDLKIVLGKPNYYVKTENEQIIGYIVNDEFKLLFVFDYGDKEDKLYLKHYSVLYPEGTKNNMTNNQGREW